MRKKAFGTHEIARICHVTPPTVGRWIEEGKIPSFATAGGHRRVWDNDLRAFLQSLNMPVPPDVAGDHPDRIVIVDDEPEVRRFLKRVIADLYGPAAEVLEAGDGFDAGQKIATAEPAVVVLDIQLPGVDGYRVCQMIRANETLKNVKIIGISGHDVDETRKRVLKAGANDFVAKPFTAEELGGALKKLLPSPANVTK